MRNVPASTLISTSPRPSPDEAFWESFDPVVDLKANPCLSGGIGMADAGLWVGDTKLGKNCLVGDFPRKTDISRFYLLGGRAHEDATPMRRRARNMCRSVGRESLEMVGDILASARQDQGASAENGAK